MNSSIKNNFIVSVIIPCYNVVNYINECVKSVVNQDYEFIELICIDNASTDNTYQKLTELKSKYGFKLFQCTLPGANNARNLGIEKSSGLWIQFLDADDILYPSKISHQINLIKNSKKDVDFIVASRFHKDLKQNIKTVIPSNDKFIGILESNFGTTSCNFFKAKTLIHLNGWDANLKSSQEYDLMFRIIQHDYQFIIDLKPLTLIRERGIGQISYRNPKLKWNQFVDLRLDIINYLKKEESNYYLSNEIIIKQILFDIIRILIKYDEKRALFIYNKYLIDFKPKKSLSTGFLYLLIFNIVGFRRTEKIKRFLSLN
ncbi:MAG: glycosyl transferase family 2 [Crocinitomicaceae bacterium]|nr:glycosyl transferase family 2 [Crocinitomicaceae bacterium]